MFKKSLTAGLMAAMATSAMAGGPVIVEEEEVVAESGSSVGILPLIIIGIALCAAVCGDDDPVPVTSAP